MMRNRFTILIPIIIYYYYISNDRILVIVSDAVNNLIQNRTRRVVSNLGANRGIIIICRVCVYILYIGILLLLYYMNRGIRFECFPRSYNCALQFPVTVIEQSSIRVFEYVFTQQYGRCRRCTVVGKTVADSCGYVYLNSQFILPLPTIEQ